jgi:ATP-binding cassette subfamily F protein 3
MQLSKLSGGQRTRAVLARLLLANPELLVMDEPTNHLDITAVEWLEGYFNQWKGAALIVSHDRYFLDKVCNVVWEIQPTNLELYHGNYSAYVQQRLERWELRQQQFTAEKERLEKEMAYIKRNIAGQNVTQARGKLRRVSRIIETVEQLGFEGMQGKRWSQISPSVQISVSMMSPDEAAHRIQALRGPSNRPPRMKLNLRTRQRSGNIVMRTEDLRIGYGNANAGWKPLVAVPDLELRRLECAALIGPNGSGKTTFLKTILGLVSPLEGEVLMGASLQVGYFTQGHEDLVAERTLMQEIDSVAPHLLPADIRNHLARYLFSGDDVFKQVNTLSGGERGRLALAKLALLETNLLLLDEPTNHLDIPSQEILQSVLDEYQGTIILVTHDRYLVDRLATQIWEIIPAEIPLSRKADTVWGNMRVFQGTYSQYRLQQEQAAREMVNGGAVIAGKEGERETELRERSRLKNRSQSEIRRRATRLSELEHQIAEYENQIKVLSRQLETPPTDIAEIHRLGKQYVCFQDELNILLAEWEQIQGN